MTDEEMAALAAALNLVQERDGEDRSEPPASRWKMAARLPELEMEELRALH